MWELEVELDSYRSSIKVLTLGSKEKKVITDTETVAETDVQKPYIHFKQ